MFGAKLSYSFFNILRAAAIAGGFIVVVAFLWKLADFFLFSKHSLIVSNTSEQDIVVVGAAIDGKIIARRAITVNQASKLHLASKKYVQFELPAQGGIYRLSLFTKEGAKKESSLSCELNIPQDVDCIVMARKDSLGALLCTCDYMDYSSL